MANDKVYLYHGTVDYTVTEGQNIAINVFKNATTSFIVFQGVVKKNEDFYKKYLADSQIKKVYTYGSSHGFVSFIELKLNYLENYFTLKLQITNNYGAGCNVLSPPNYLNNCNYNQAYDMLKHLYTLTTSEPSKTTSYTEKVTK